MFPGSIATWWNQTLSVVRHSCIEHRTVCSEVVNEYDGKTAFEGVRQPVSTLLQLQEDSLFWAATQVWGMLGGGWGRGPHWVSETSWEREEAEQEGCKRQRDNASFPLLGPFWLGLIPQAPGQSSGQEPEVLLKELLPLRYPRILMRGKTGNMLWMDQEFITLKQSKSERQIPYDITDMRNLKCDKMNLFMKQKQNQGQREQTCGCQAGWGMGKG